MAERVTEREQFYYGKGYNKAIEEAADLARKPNKMQIVAAQFGKKLGEEFTVKYQVSKYKWCIEYHLAFTDKGLIHYGKSKDIILRQLLTGQAMIINEDR